MFNLYRIVSVLVLVSLVAFVGCEKDEEESEGGRAVDCLSGCEAGSEGGSQAGSEAGSEGGEAAGEESPVAGESNSNQDVSGGEEQLDCAPEFEAEDGCEEPLPVVDPACEAGSLEEGEDCDDSPEAGGSDGTESTSETPSDMGV
mgnify:CR=1 FL=1|tara:strand:+ start:1792 stop:2226 length:435 start_codon:yes stop_codon:yes gene_type:complete